MIALEQAEIIQILRKRTGLNQGDFGAGVFRTSVDSGRTKIKNIELGRQKPSAGDLRRIADFLEVPLSLLKRKRLSRRPDSPARADGLHLPSPVLERFPGLGTYLEMLIRAVRVDDQELVCHISRKVAELMNGHPPLGERSGR